MKRLIITRHGETLENASGIIQGHLPGTLSALGIEQARKLALRLKDEKIEYIFSSDLTRALDTANQIRKYHSNAIFVQTNELRENYLGAWQGKTKRELGITEGYRPPLPFDAETRDQIYLRARKFLEDLRNDYNGRNLLLVGHNGINKALLAVLMERASEDVKNIETQHNTGVNIFELSGKSYIPLVLNCIEHLS